MAVSKTDVAKLYIGLFGRLPEGEGLNYWYNQAIENGWDMATLADNMYYAASQLFPEYTDVQKVVESIYQNVLGKSPTDDPDGIAYWVNEIQSGKTTVSKAVADIIYVAETQYPDNPATKTLQNRAKAGVEIAKTFQKADIDGDGKIDALFTEKLSLINDKDFTTDKAVGQAILESWGKDKVLDIMQDLPLALSGSLEMWKLATTNVINAKEYNYHWNSQTYEKLGNNYYAIEYSNASYNTIKDVNGRFKANSTDDYKHININITENGFSYKTIDKDIEFDLKPNTVINIDAPEYSWNGNWDTNRPYVYDKTLVINNITGKVEVKHIDANDNVLDTDIINLSNVEGTVTNGYSYSMFNANLEGTIEIDGKTYTFRTENLTINDWKDPDWTTKWYKGTHLPETQIYGTIYLTDEEGNELEFTYRNEDVNTESDNNFSVEYNNFYVDFYDLIV